MATNAKAAATRAQSDAPAEDYLALVREFPLVPIRDDAHHDAAIARVNGLVKHQGNLTAGQMDYLLALSTLIEHHETELYGKAEPLGPERALRGLIESKGVTQAEVSRATGVSDTTISDILAGRRSPSKKAMAALGEYFRVPPGYFL